MCFTLITMVALIEINLMEREMNYLGNFITGKYIKELISLKYIEIEGMMHDGAYCEFEIECIEDEDVFIGMNNPNLSLTPKLHSFWYVFKQSVNNIEMASVRFSLLVKYKDQS